MTDSCTSCDRSVAERLETTRAQLRETHTYLDIWRSRYRVLRRACIAATEGSSGMHKGWRERLRAVAGDEK